MPAVLSSTVLSWRTVEAATAAGREEQQSGHLLNLAASMTDLMPVACSAVAAVAETIADLLPTVAAVVAAAPAVAAVAETTADLLPIVAAAVVVATAAVVRSADLTKKSCHFGLLRLSLFVEPALPLEAQRQELIDHSACPNSVSLVVSSHSCSCFCFCLFYYDFWSDCAVFCLDYDYVCFGSVFLTDCDPFCLVYPYRSLACRDPDRGHDHLDDRANPYLGHCYSIDRCHV